MVCLLAIGEVWLSHFCQSAPRQLWLKITYHYLPVQLMNNGLSCNMSSKSLYMSKPLLILYAKTLISIQRVIFQKANIRSDLLIATI